jgi:hypothetical protein
VRADTGPSAWASVGKLIVAMMPTNAAMKNRALRMMYLGWLGV